MITTDCEGCCFLKQDDKGKGCIVGQFCVTQNEKTFAPGYCRLCRSHKWAKQKNITNTEILREYVLREQWLEFDMLVFFDESINKIEDLQKTLWCGWYSPYMRNGKIIIVDTTGFGNRKNLALQFLKNRKYPTEIIIDSSVVHEPIGQREESIQRISSQIKSPFFLVIPAGTSPENLNIDQLARDIKYIYSRVIHWSFPTKIGLTTLILNKFYYGLFITKPYQVLMKSLEVESFTKQLKKEEVETDMGLTWFCSNCCITSDCETKC